MSVSSLGARATSLFGIDHPVLLGPFGGVSSVRLAAAVSDAGGLGSFGLYGYDAARIATVARDLRAATDRPFALNLWLPLDDTDRYAVEEAEFRASAAALEPWFDELALPLPDPPARYLPTFDEQLEAVLEARPAVLSLVFGVPPADIVERARALGIRVVAAATTVEEAVALEAGGVDAVIASGMEAGGHRVSFLRAAEESLVGTMALVPRTVDAVDVPVIAAGGIADGRGLAAALALGADGVQVGSAFLATDDSAAAPVYRAVLREGADETVLTRALSGRLARAVPTRLTAAGGPVAPFPVQNWLTAQFREVAAQRGVADLMSLWAGQGTPLARERDAARLLAGLVETAGRILA
jgi:nitronate monooxygenase